MEGLGDSRHSQSSVRRGSRRAVGARRSGRTSQWWRVDPPSTAERFSPISVIGPNGLSASWSSARSTSGADAGRRRRKAARRPAAPRLGPPGPGVRGVPGGGRRAWDRIARDLSRTQSGSRREMYANGGPRAAAGGRFEPNHRSRRRRHNHDSGLKPPETLRRAGLLLTDELNAPFRNSVERQRLDEALADISLISLCGWLFPHTHRAFLLVRAGGCLGFWVLVDIPGRASTGLPDHAETVARQCARGALPGRHAAG